MMELLSDPQVWLAFVTLTALEIVLGIETSFHFDLVSRLPKHQQPRGRTIGLSLAMGTRILCCCPLLGDGTIGGLFMCWSRDFRSRFNFDGGGLFLLAKSTLEYITASKVPNRQRAKRRVKRRFCPS